MAYITIQPIDCVVGGTHVTMPLTYVELRDHATGYNLNGSYHIQVKTGSTLGPQYVVTYGLRPADSANLLTIWRAVLTATGEIFHRDCRPLNIAVQAVNSTVAQTAFSDGSYLQDGVVTPRACAGNLLGGTGGLLDGIGSAEGDLVVRGSTEWEALTPGTSGYVLTSNGSGSVPTWQAGGGGGTVTVPEGSSFPGTPTTWQLFWRTDLSALFVYNGSSWKSADTLAELNDVSLTSPATNDLLTYNGSAWVNKTLSAEIDAAIGSTRGAILYRGSSGWAILTPGTSTYVLTSNGSGSDPSWQAGGGSGVTSLNTETGAITLESTGGTLAITRPDSSHINIEVSGVGGGSAYDAAILAESSLAHYWPMSEASGASSILDKKGSSNLTVHGSPSIGSRPLVRDNLPSIGFFMTAGDYLDFPNGLIPASTTDWTFEIIVRAIGGANRNRFGMFFTADGSAPNFRMYYDANNWWQMSWNNNGSAYSPSNPSPPDPGLATHMAVTWQHSSSTITWYVNGYPQNSNSGATAPSQTAAGFIGKDASSGLEFLGHVAKMAIYNSALSKTAIRTHIANM